MVTSTLQPLVLKHGLSSEVEKFVLLCHDLGIVMTGSARLQESTHQVLYPTPLSRILVLDTSTLA